VFVQHLIRRWEKQGLEPWEIKTRLKAFQRLEGAVFALVLAGAFMTALLYLSDWRVVLPGVERFEVASETSSGESPWEFAQPLPDSTSDMNLNGDGELTEDEVRKFFASHKNDPSITKSQRKEKIRTLRRMTALRHSLRVRDQNQDGFVTLAETYQYLHRYDLNKNGVLEDEEHEAAELGLRLKVPERINDIRRGRARKDGEKIR